MASFKPFGRDDRGAVAVTVALLFVLLLVAAGAAIDFGRAYYVNRTLKGVVDAAVLAAGRKSVPISVTDKQAIETILGQTAQSYINTNLDISPKLATTGARTTTYFPKQANGADAVSVSIPASVPTEFLFLVGLNSINFTVTSKAERPQAGPLDLALVLDQTGSMNSSPAAGGEAKLTSLKTAATELVNEVMARGGDSIRVGLVPFNNYVRTGVISPTPDWVMPMDANGGVCDESGWSNPEGICQPPDYYDCLVDGVMTTNGCWRQDCSNKGVWQCIRAHAVTFTWNGCIGARSVISPNNPNDPGQNRWNETYLDNISDPTVQPYPGMNTNSACNTNTLLPLNSSLDKVRQVINNMGASGETFIPIGLIWGWNILAPGEPYDARSLSELQAIGGRKSLVLMTDGINSLAPRLFDGSLFLPIGSPYLPDDWRDGTKTNNLTAKICDNIKKDGIEVYTVLFDVPAGSNIESILRNCASDPSKAFSVADKAGLLAAFRDISESLKPLRLVE